MAKVEKLKELVAALKAKSSAMAGRTPGPSATVSYSTKYALFVHEDLEAKHKTGQAKYLEAPARSFATVLGDLVIATLRAGKTLAQALLVAALRLQRESQLLVPVDTSTLKNSATTTLEE